MKGSHQFWSMVVLVGYILLFRWVMSFPHDSMFYFRWYLMLLFTAAISFFDFVEDEPMPINPFVIIGYLYTCISKAIKNFNNFLDKHLD